MNIEKEHTPLAGNTNFFSIRLCVSCYRGTRLSKQMFILNICYESSFEILNRTPKSDFFPNRQLQSHTFSVLFRVSLAVQGFIRTQALSRLDSVLSCVIENIDVFHFKIMFAHTLKLGYGASVWSFRNTRVCAYIYTHQAGTPLIIRKTSCQLSL